MLLSILYIGFGLIVLLSSMATVALIWSLNRERQAKYQQRYRTHMKEKLRIQKRHN